MRVYLSPSDQVENKYAYGNTTEAAECRKIARACKKALERNGITVKLDCSDGSQAMYKRVNQSNNFNADLHVCIHSNAYNHTVAGTRIFTYKRGNVAQKYADAIYKLLAPLSPGTSDNVSTAAWYELKQTKAPAVYIEIAFHDTKLEAKWIVENTTLIAETIAHGIVNAAGLVWREVEQATPLLYAVQVGAFSIKANAEKLSAELAAKGYNNIIVEKGAIK